MTNDSLTFNVSITNDLSCVNTTDQFSISNSNALLTYKVGLMTRPELYLLNIFTSPKAFWLISPYDLYYANFGSRNNTSRPSGFISYYQVQEANGVRPAISLKPGIKYIDGDGSNEHPYVIQTN